MYRLDSLYRYIIGCAEMIGIPLELINKLRESHVLFEIDVGMLINYLAVQFI